MSAESARAVDANVPYAANAAATNAAPPTKRRRPMRDSSSQTEIRSATRVTSPIKGKYPNPNPVNPLIRLKEKIQFKFAFREMCPYYRPREVAPGDRCDWIDRGKCSTDV